MLVVEGLELLVDALEFFIRALEFLVGGVQFLVRCLQFLVGGLQFLDGGLEAQAAFAEFLLQHADALHAFEESDLVLLVAIFFVGILEEDEEVNLVILRGAEAFHGQHEIRRGLLGVFVNRAEMAGLLFGEDFGGDGGEDG